MVDLQNRGRSSVIVSSPFACDETLVGFSLFSLLVNPALSVVNFRKMFGYFKRLCY